MKFSLRLLALFLSINSLIYQKEIKALTVTIQQTGADVLFSFDGSIDLTGATKYESPPGTPMRFAVKGRFRSSGTDINRFIGMGGVNGENYGIAHRWDFGTGVVVPVFGTNVNALGAGTDYGDYTVTGSGDPLRIKSDYLLLPETYNSGDTISGEMRFSNTTIADLHLTMGSVSYQLGNNTMEIVTMPAPLPILGLPVVFSYFKKLKEKSRLHRGAKGAPIGASNSKL